MNLLDSLSLLTPMDFAALTFLFAAWIATGWLVEHPVGGQKSTAVLMHAYREEWMREMVTREPRIFDSAILGTLRQGTTFFASSAMLAIGGGLALIGNPQPLSNVAEELIQGDAPRVVWEIKILVMLVFLVGAFLRFVWSHRLFGYCAVIMAAVPNDPADPRTYPRAAKAGEISTLAARSFNRGMRSVYFGLAATGWLAGALPLIVTTVAVVAMIWRREFASQSRAALLKPDL
ncbi:DUF599 domain-containing protein [Tropicimonas sp.]|uniref:DUF599 domain-containing protein n=1 Tax=Tropicimonas sp. TaxID=2067044 RepID=UPI003A875E30